MEQLKVAAQLRGLSVIRKRKTGPFLVMESKTGKTVGSYTNQEEAEKVIMSYDLLPDPEDKRPVVWNWDVNIVETPKLCPNNHGPTCLCLDISALYLCAVPQCLFQAGCYGCCRAHYSQLKVFGDLTKNAIAKTAILAENGEFDLEHLPEYKKMLSIKTVIPTDRNKKNLTPAEIIKATSGIIGMSVVWTGADYRLVDKDGIVLDTVISKEELFEEE